MPDLGKYLVVVELLPGEEPWNVVEIVVVDSVDVRPSVLRHTSDRKERKDADATAPAQGELDGPLTGEFAGRKPVLSDRLLVASTSRARIASGPRLNGEVVNLDVVDRLVAKFGESYVTAYRADRSAGWESRDAVR